MKRRWVLLHPPKSGGRSRHGAPVRIIQKTALIKRRLSWALPPQLPSRPGKWGSSFFQTESEMSCRLWAAVGICSSLTLEGKRTMPQNENLDNLVTTLPKSPRHTLPSDATPDSHKVGLCFRLGWCCFSRFFPSQCRQKCMHHGGTRQRGDA